MTETTLDRDDLRQLEQHGIGAADAQRQLELLTGSPRFARLVRPATVGDGVRRIAPAEVEGLNALHAGAAREGRLLKFTPASGAATRMFRDLLHFHRGEGRGKSWETVRRGAEAGSPEAAALLTVVEQRRRLPFYEELAQALARQGHDLERSVERGDFGPVLEALLDDGGLGYANMPKALLKFHRYPAASRTAFEEHLVEAAHYARTEDGVSRLHFTVSPEHREAFGRRLAEVAEVYRRSLDTSYEVDYSVQHASTDTLAIDESERPLRDAAGRLRLRPGGHGALIGNLHDLGADLILVKNIDNVQPDQRKRATLGWKRILVGLLVRVQREVFEELSRLRAGGTDLRTIERSLRFARDELGLELDTSGLADDHEKLRAWLIDRLDRPLRVCGVVPNTGEPGGGPFWVRGRDGSVSLQIVESAQVDTSDPEQRDLFGRSTHFNPVDLVCAVRDVDGAAFDLRRYVDPETAIVTHKSDGGQDVRVLERPGLWNGAMADWSTVFVEVPIETFSPVKTVLDFLRPEHQPE